MEDKKPSVTNAFNDDMIILIQIKMQCTHFHFAQNRGWERKKTKPEEDQKERGGD